ncbi:unnamed protein product [Phaedon cochleariae]|uniref:Sushi, von Willebrand factor type A, EGF and pentraxin domain-containing protein 1 n=1 Tax=Phaedon cochleariae TaxID=80249 RepID=A0A9P0DPF0_PHACE|nr:unnamed protein product [Phaedon cochleariae]
MNIHLSLLLLTLIIKNLAEKINLDTLNNYSEFLNFGDKKLHKVNRDRLENEIFKSKIDVLGEVFKNSVDLFKISSKLDIVFLIDASSSVGEHNFKSELKFVKKLLSDLTVDYNHTRVAVVTYSSPSNIVKNIDEIGEASRENNKCLLLNKQLNNISYKGGETFTLGAFKTAKEIFDSSNRNDSKKVIFLITDGYSNGGDPTPIAEELKKGLITIFTIGIQNGNFKELYEVSSSPGEYYSYLLDSYYEFESLARRALHVDLKSGDYIPLGFNKPCDILCEEGDCCDQKALCTCGTTTGHYSCICQPGYYGSGLKNNCFPCIPGTYSDGPNLCLPCPDQLHTTIAPALGMESCVCKEGYRATKNNGCKELKCPKITNPEHGYYVKRGHCPNVIYSACGIRCEVGYSLKGTSIRLCEKNGTWSGIEPVCEIRTCNRLEIPKDGKMTCSHPDLGEKYDNTQKKFPVDAVCTFGCPEGKILIGSKQRTCLPIARWDGLRTLCKPIKCKKLPQVKYGNIEPNSCKTGKQEFGKTCKITCNDGFNLRGPSEKKCIGPHGAWDSKFEDTLCSDVTPPEVICPEDIVSNSLPLERFGYVSWNPPNITDNSGLNVTSWMKPAIENITMFNFEIGTTLVTYYVQDAFQNTANCSFHVTIRDKEPPSIENCIDPPPYLTGDENGANITWDEPNIFDNSQSVMVIRSHQSSYFTVGTTTVTYTATDYSNNTNTCKINITVEVSHCESLPDPPNGHSECMNHSNGIQCLITCEEGYAIPISQSYDQNGTNFICSHADPIWYIQEGLFPECTVTKIPEETIQSGEISIENVNCTEGDNMEELENEVRVMITTEICIGNCTLETETECEVEKEEEESNKIMSKREIVFEEVPHRNRTKKHRRKFNVKFQVKGKYLNETSNITHSVLPSGYNVSIHYKELKFICPSGFIPRKNRCVQCPKGTFHNATTHKCQSCPFGYFNNKLAQTECTSCPLNFSTRKMHSKTMRDCEEQCSPGTHARKKKLKFSKRQPKVTIVRTTLKPYCRSCGVGYYQPDYGQLKCIPCRPGYTTTSVRSTSIYQCIPISEEICRTKNVCIHGICAPTNYYHYTCHCSHNYIGSYCEKAINFCDSQPCLNGGICTNLASGCSCTCRNGFKGTFCEDAIEDCESKCLNNGVCIQDDIGNFTCGCNDGYGGEFCEIKVRPCDENTCDNNATCIEENGTFRCLCINGFIGKRCNLLPCDYRPCKSNEICLDLADTNSTRGSFRCECPEGYTGENCMEKIDFCVSSPCLNGGSCTNNLTDYICECSNLYYGPICENKRNTKYLLNFEHYDTNNYIKLRGFTQNITEMTACLWMITLDNFNYGTLISYATRQADNAFTITDYTGLVLYVNNNYIITDVFLNDGGWHHLCITWKSLNGSYAVYVDGKLEKAGFGLSSETNIQGMGHMIIGQEQDNLGGKFSQSETFIGKMAYVDIWSKALDYRGIMTHFNDCNESFFGDLYAWPVMQDYIQGSVTVVASSFCKGCEQPKPLYNGLIDIVDNIAYYSCYKGYQLNDLTYLKGRKCTKVSKWEGLYEPYCKKIYCGYPGFLRNGYSIGNKYFYQDKILFSCFDGFNLTGNNLISCREDGKWYPEKPTCLGIQCTAFQKPKNSELIIISEHSYEDYRVNQTKFDIGTQIEIVCNERANLTNENVLTCLENGTWDNEPPICRSKEEPAVPKSECPIAQIPKPPNNGFIDQDSLYAVGNGTSNHVEYRCKPGFKLYGENVTTCIIDGYWSEPNISCNAIVCGNPPVFRNMMIKENLKKSSYKFGNMLSYVCDEGYNMFGTNMVRCMINGKWSRMQGKCIKKSCRKPNVKEDTEIVGKSYLYGDTVKITCQNGVTYKLVCNKKGIWEGVRDESC